MNDEKSRLIVRDIVAKSSDTQREALINWAHGLLDIRQKQMSALSKAKAAIGLTLRSKIIWPVVKSFAAKIKHIAWDPLGKSARMGFGAAAVGIAVFGGKAAGIGALGTAIGLPLWVVLGAGAAFASLIVEEVKRARSRGASYTVIDADEIKPPVD